MIRTRALLAGFAVAACPAVAMAADQNINLTAEVPRFCKFDGVPQFGALTNFTVGSIGMASSTINMSSATNASGLMNDASFRVRIAATCNFASNISLASINGGLKDSTPEAVVSGTFLNRIDYRAGLSEWGSAGLVEFITSGTPTSVSAGAASPHAGDVVVLVHLEQNTTAPLAAGDYTDTLRISLTPQ